MKCTGAAFHKPANEIRFFSY